MNSILAVEKGLPPGLWLPTADEPTDKYRSENFRRNDLPYEDIVEYGSFVVAMALRSAPQTGRINFIPKGTDITEMYQAGYGFPIDRLEPRGGMSRLQHALGFYPRRFIPTREELLARLRWMATYSLDVEEDLNGSRNVRSIMLWGSARNLLPGIKVMQKVLGKDTTPEIQRIFAIEKPNSREQLSYLDVYRFGAKVLSENDGKPLRQQELDAKYKDYFLAAPYSVLVAFFGASNKFWLEFGHLTHARGFSPNELINIGVRYAIETGQPSFSHGDIVKLSADNKLPSTYPMGHYFDGVVGYRDRVNEHYDKYVSLRDELVAQGISPEAVKTACREFEANEEFAGWLRENADVLQKLSRDLPAAKYALRLMSSGFSLLDEEIFMMQYVDLRRGLQSLGITSEEKLRFVFRIIPRINADEALAMKIEEN